MWHPNPEDLARLVDEPPAPAEAEHLAGCAECAAELAAMRAEHDALGALPRILPVPTSWEVMRHRLEREGLLSATRGRMAWMPGVAAALALFLAGGATGVLLAGGGSGARDVATVSDPTRAAPTVGARDARGYDTIEQSVAEPARTGPPTGYAVPAPTAAPARLAARSEDARPGSDRSSQGMRPARDDADLPSLRGTPAGMPNWDAVATLASRARTPDEAARYVRDAEGAYVAAMTRFAELTSEQSSDPAVRLATLDGIVVTTAAALERAPADPVINGYHLAARAQRDALLRTVSSSPAQDPWY